MKLQSFCSFMDQKKKERKMAASRLFVYGDEVLSLRPAKPTPGLNPSRFPAANVFFRPLQPFRRLLLRITAKAVKRSPKRLKYSAPHFSKEDGLLYMEADPSGSDSWKLEPVVQLLREGAVGVIPTDTLYAIVCDVKNHSAIGRLRRIKNIDPHKPLSILCRSLRDIDTYTTGFPRGDGQGHANLFRAVKHCLPGPYTFILTASKELPRQCVRYGTLYVKYAPRKNVGVRLPDDPICQAILQKMDAPLISSSIRCPKDNEWLIDPAVIADKYGSEGLDFVVNGGVRVADLSTVVDMAVSPPKVLRKGKGPILHWMTDEDGSESSLLTEDRIPSGT